jgi:mannose-6-phosphate isomerase-like protein (cupin superfamily)
MRRTLQFAVVLVAALGLSGRAQQAPAQAPAQPAASPAPAAPVQGQGGGGGGRQGGGGGGGAQDSPREPPANTATGVSVDRFYGDPSRSIPHVSHDMIMTRSILRAGDPYTPGADGAVLQYRKELVLGTMNAGQTTSMTTMPEQQVVYVESGSGKIDDGTLYWDLKPGIMILVPPGQQHRYTSTGDQPLKMLMLSWTLEPGITPHKGLLVRDVNVILYTERNVHWSNFAKYVFDDRDGMHPSDRFYIVEMAPMTMAGPHAHVPNAEEAWVKISDGPSLMEVGSEIRPWPINVGILAPPNGQTVHAAINTSDTLQSWFYFARLNPNAQPRATPPPAPAGGAAPAAGRGGGGGGRGGGGNAAVADSLVRSTLAGKPLR